MKISKLKIISLITLVTLSGCSRNIPNSCNSNKVKTQLLQSSRLNTSGVNFIAESIVQIEMLGKSAAQKTLSCMVKINYTHNVFPEQTINSSFRYQVSSSSQVNGFSYASGREEYHFVEWLYSLPNVVSYQRSRFGVLAILQNGQNSSKSNTNQTQQLSLNNNVIDFPDNKNYSTITIDKKFYLNHTEVFLISAYFNGRKDDNSDHNYLLAIESANQAVLTKAFSYQEGSLQQKHDEITFNGRERRPYAESSDYPIYGYKNQQLELIQPSKPDSYYHAKFANLTATHILQQIKADGCLNGDQFYSSEICSPRIALYCFQLSSINPKAKDKSYWLLQQMCKNQDLK